MIILGEVLPVFGITVRSYDCTRGSNTHSHMTIQFYGYLLYYVPGHETGKKNDLALKLVSVAPQSSPILDNL